MSGREADHAEKSVAASKDAQEAERAIMALECGPASRASEARKTTKRSKGLGIARRGMFHVSCLMDHASCIFAHHSPSRSFFLSPRLLSFSLPRSLALSLPLSPRALSRARFEQALSTENCALRTENWELGTEN